MFVWLTVNGIRELKWERDKGTQVGEEEGTQVGEGYGNSCGRGIRE